MTVSAGTFFTSRWVERPDHVADLGGEGLPPGFRAAGVAAGIKPSGAPDVGLLVCDSPAAASAARFTASAAQGLLNTIALAQAIGQVKVRADLAKLTRINSIGVRNWIMFVKA